MSERSDIKILGIEESRELSLARTILSQKSYLTSTTTSASSSGGANFPQESPYEHQHQQRNAGQEVNTLRNFNVSLSLHSNSPSTRAITSPRKYPTGWEETPSDSDPDPSHYPPCGEEEILVEEVVLEEEFPVAAYEAATISTASSISTSAVGSCPTSSNSHNSDGTSLSVHRLIHCHALTSPPPGEGDNSQELDLQQHEVHVTTITGDPNQSDGDEDDEDGEHGLTTYSVLTEEVLTTTDIDHNCVGHQLQVEEVEEVEPLLEDEVHANCREVQDENGTTTVRINITSGHHQHLQRSHHLNESGRATTRLITIPVVGSLANYTVLSQSDSDDTNNGTLNVSLSSDGEHMVHEHDEESMVLDQEQTVTMQQELIPSPPITNQNQSNSHVTWEEAVAASILPVRCKDTNAELYKGKFGSGNKGKCIKFANEWYTPTEFEALCGRGNSKDWKRSIRFGGRTLQTLIDKGHLIPHASSCICSNCVDDATATGPIRPFTPYQRKRKGQSVNEHVKGTKLERLTSKDSTTDESSDIGTPITPLGVTTALNPLTQALMKINNINLPSCTQEAWKVVEDAVDSLTTASASLKAIVQEMRERTNQEIDSVRSQLQNSVQTTLVQNPVVGHPQILRIFDSNRIQTYSIEVLDPDSFKPMQSNSISMSKCDNCGRDGSLECSGCHVVHYCSSFCQKKDWPLHQAACQDQMHVECKEEPDMDMK